MTSDELRDLMAQAVEQGLNRATDAERLKKKGVISPDLNKMKIMAINLKMRSVTYFRSEAQYQRWAKSVENLNDYKIKINGKIVKQPN